MKITATPIKAADLQPGDLFSTLSQTYWDCFPALASIGERVYIRTCSPPHGAADAETSVYLIEIEK